MSGESPDVIIYDVNGNALAVQNATAIPTSTPALMIAGSDGTNSRYISLDTSGRLVVTGAGTAGTSTGGVLSIQGVAGGTVVPISGTVATTQSTSPWADNITQIGGVAVAAVAKGVQASNALGTQDLKDSGRVSFVAAALAVTGVTTEALLTLTPVRIVTAGTAGVSLTVTSGKTLRIQAISVTIRNTSTTQCSVVCRVRMNSTTVTATSQLFFTCGAAALTAVSGSTNNETFMFPDGFEISGTTQFGITQLASATTCTVDITLIGFEY